MVDPVTVARFDATAYKQFRFTHRSLDQRGHVRLGYALDDQHEFVEEFVLPVPETRPADADAEAIEHLLDLLHWVAGVSFYKTAAPPQVSCETGAPPPAAATFLEALYSEGLGEFAVENQLPRLPRPTFPRSPGMPNGVSRRPPTRVLVPIGGGKDSIVALEIVRHSGLDFSLFSVDDEPAMQRTAAVAGVPRLVVDRRFPLEQIKTLNAAGALNGHIPITAIIACVALLTARLNGFDAIALGNERSASRGNLDYDGIEVNHQFSKSKRAEAMLRAAADETGAGVNVFSILRPASELAIARRFAAFTSYHAAFTSCNRTVKRDRARREATWCGKCPKCHFVFLVLAPFLDPSELAGIFGGKALLDDESQYQGFALLTATGGHKPFECVGEEEESLAAIELLAADERWRDRPVVRRLVDEVLRPRGLGTGRVAAALTLNDDHWVPDELIEDVRALLGA
jgi:hypothetical protein